MWLAGITILFFLALWSIWPVRSLIIGIFSKSETLLIFTNEAEARPCGGFITAYGSWKWLPPSLNLKNVYHLNYLDLGESDYPLSEISPTKNFWDLADTPDLGQCTRKIAYHYQTNEGKLPTQVILVDIGTIERVIDRLGGIRVQGNYIDSDNFFGFLTRSVADIDRHDETALQNRKAPLAGLGKRLVLKALFRPWEWRALSLELKRSLDRGDVFVETTSPDIKPEKNDFALIEWNLGGGKSSRFLQKKMTVNAFESAPEQWRFQVQLSVYNAGGHDEPLSQNWSGLFELKVPESLDQNNAQWKLDLETGELAQKTFVYDFQGPISQLDFFRPRGQDYELDAFISLFPQQSFARHNFTARENVGHYKKEFESFRQSAIWEIKSDKMSPFLTLHTVIAYDNLPPEIRKDFEPKNTGDIWAELHFNEPVQLTENFEVSIEDRNFTIKEETPELKLSNYKSLSDQRTLVLHFEQEKFQKDERFHITTTGVTDLFGNQIKPVKRTLITR